MSFDDKSPYYSKRVRIADIKSPKEYVGMKEMTVEIIYGNQETRKIIKNKEDLADIEERNIFEDIEQVYKQRDIWCIQRGYKFLDQIGNEKNE